MIPRIGERIREARQARGISLRQLASQVGIHFSHLSKIENGKDTVGKNSLIRIAEELDIDTDLILSEAGYQAMPYRILGDIAAGVPIDAIEDVESFDLSQVFAPREHFLLRVRGESMILDGINDGDLAIVRHTDEVRDGDTVVALVDGGEATLKRYKMERGTVVLTPANQHMQVLKYPAERVEIRGLLVGVLRTSVK